MDILSVLKHEAKSAYAWLQRNAGCVTQELAIWIPPGTANSIAATYAHTVISADVDINRHFHGHPTVLSEGWGTGLRLNESFRDDWPADAVFDWDTLRLYGDAVADRLTRRLELLTLADLERSFQMVPESLGIWKGVDVYLLHCSGHVRMHGGEIACLKGIQGLSGYTRAPSLSLYRDT